MDLTEKQTITVKELNTFAKNLIENDGVLQNFWIRGEISGLKKAMSGHVYFTLKDEEAALSVAFFKSQAFGVDFEDLVGKEVLVKGRLSLYEKTGQYQLYGQKIEAFGAGAMFAEIEKLKRKLQGEGLFDAVHKKPLPDRIQRIGVVTSGSGAVIHDIMRVVGKRNPFVELILFPVAVQGDSAPMEIIHGIETFNRYEKIDLIIVGRGGGSMEDLMAFNHEGVVRAVFDSKIPIISAVGHETDNPLCDYAADLRGATPSQAAELATENIEDRYLWLLERLRKDFGRLERRLDEYYQGLDLKMEKLKAFFNRTTQLKNRLDNKYLTLERLFLQHVKDRSNQLRHMGEKLHLVSPLAILNRGYSLVYDRDKNIVKNSKETVIGDGIDIRLGIGSLHCLVQGKEEQNE